MTIQMQELLMCLAVFAALGFAGLYFAEAERRGRDREIEDNVKMDTGEAIYRVVNPSGKSVRVETMGGAVVVRPGSFVDLAKPDPSPWRGEKAYVVGDSEKTL